MHQHGMHEISEEYQPQHLAAHVSNPWTVAHVTAGSAVKQNQGSCIRQTQICCKYLKLAFIPACGSRVLFKSFRTARKSSSTSHTASLLMSLVLLYLTFINGPACSSGKDVSRCQSDYCTRASVNQCTASAVMDHRERPGLPKAPGAHSSRP